MDISNILEKIKESKRKIIRMIIILLILGIMGIGAAGFGIYSFAKSRVNYTQHDAQKIALELIPGEVINVRKTFDDDTFSFEYEFDIKDKSNILREVTVNSNNGTISDLDYDNYFIDNF